VADAGSRGDGEGYTRLQGVENVLCPRRDLCVGHRHVCERVNSESQPEKVTYITFIIYFIYVLFSPDKDETM
jgi:hypothetical protein